MAPQAAVYVVVQLGFGTACWLPVLRAAQGLFVPTHSHSCTTVQYGPPYGKTMCCCTTPPIIPAGAGAQAGWRGVSACPAHQRGRAGGGTADRLQHAVTRQQVR
jgi:hypothetical protein